MLDRSESANWELDGMGNSTRSRIPKVLILSHNPLSKNQSNGKTIYSMLKYIPKENLAQVYLTTDTPDFDLCNNYFQIDDFDILRKLFYGKEFGRSVKSKDISEQIHFKEEVRNSLILNIIRHTKGPLFNILRDSLWMIIGYREKLLRQFIMDFNPDILFFQSSGNVFSFRIAQWIIRVFKLGLIMETTDDYLGKKLTINPLFWILNNRLNAEYKMISKRASMIIVISEEMKREYSKKFHSNYYVAMNSVKIENKLINNKEERCDSLRILFSGNIELNRWKTILLLSKTIEKIDFIKIELNIYTLSNINRYVKSKFAGMKKTRFHKAVDAEQLIDIRNNSDILLHVESFDFRSRYITKFSISTKISEYLASGKAILAIGPADVESIRYLKREKVAEVVTHPNKKDIENAIKRLMSAEYRIELGQKGIVLAHKNHDIERVACDIANAINDATSIHYEY